MKHINLPKWSLLTLLSAAFMTIAFIGCKKELSSPELTSNAKSAPPTTSNCAGYNVALSRTNDDAFTTTFTWTITNPNPGNGSGTTIQNLSHWTFIPGCAGSNAGLEQNWDDILVAQYNTGSGWVTIDPTPELKPDPSQSCTSANVFKFNQGTSGSTATMYRVILSGNYGITEMDAYFKSGSSTGCCTKKVQGIGCKIEDDCSLSQGYYFAKPGPTWPFEITVGGFTYTETEGRAIWNCSNKGGISDSKKAFTQYAALKLSGVVSTGDAQIDADMITIEAYLTSLGQKLVACTYLPTNTPASILAGAAGGRIGDWINNNHCED